MSFGQSSDKISRHFSPIASQVAPSPFKYGGSHLFSMNSCTESMSLPWHLTLSSIFLLMNGRISFIMASYTLPSLSRWAARNLIGIASTQIEFILASSLKDILNSELKLNPSMSSKLLNPQICTCSSSRSFSMDMTE